jgi:Domain of unknown function (DUF4249)
MTIKINDMKTKLFCFGFATTLVLSACEREVTVKLPVVDPKIVLYSVLGNNAPFTARVTKSKGILTPTNPSNPDLPFRVDNAQVLVYENGVIYDTLRFNATERIYKTIRDKRVRLGKTYDMKVSAPGLTAVEANAIVPAPVNVTSVQRLREVRTNRDGEKLDDIIIKFDDPGASRDYYLIRFSSPIYGGSYFFNLCVNSRDKDIEEIGGDFDPTDTESCLDGSRILLRDNNFNGRNKELRVSIRSTDLQNYTDPTTGRTIRPSVQVIRISEDYFKYIKSDDAYARVEDNPFAEPVLLYTNVKKGWGIFSAYSVVTDTLR